MKGMLFKLGMIQAIRDKRKTVTRRLAGLKEINQEPDKWICSGKDLFHHWLKETAFIFHHIDTNEERIIKPRYQVGETVYIKEAYAEWQGTTECVRNGDLTIAEALDYIVYKDGAKDWQGIRKDAERGHPWDIRSPLFTPAWAARYFIKITDVSASRVQKISGEDAMLEGVVLPFRVFGDGDSEYYEGIGQAYIDHYATLWNSINAKWKRAWNKDLKIYEFWQFPWSEEDGKPIPPNTKHPERYHCVPNPWVFRYEVILQGEV